MGFASRASDTVQGSKYTKARATSVTWASNAELCSMSRLLAGLAGLLLLAACAQDPPQPTYRRPPVFYFRSDFQVEVQPPQGPPAPGYLVHIYLDVDEFKRRRPYRSQITDSLGRARFRDIRMGEAYLDCTIPAERTLYDSLWVEVFGDTGTVYTLRPR